MFLDDDYGKYEWWCWWGENLFKLFTELKAKKGDTDEILRIANQMTTHIVRNKLDQQEYETMGC